MKKIQLLSILVLSGAVLFGGKATVHKAQVNFTQAALVQAESANTVLAELVIDSEVDVKGVQFDIQFNTSEIKSITPQQIENFSVEYNPELQRKDASESKVMRGIIFSLQGSILNENPKFEVEFVVGYQGTSTIEFLDIILADVDGNSIDVEAQSYGISTSAHSTPYKTELSSAYPNPFNPSTAINYSIANDGHVEVMIYDAAGRLVEELVNGHQDGGAYSITWNATNQASGMYFAKMVAGDIVQTQKLVLLK